MRVTANALPGFGLIVGLGLLLFVGHSQPAPTQQVYRTTGFRSGEEGLTASERVGRAIWFYAAAGNDRFHTYVFQQRLGVLIDWYRVLNTKSREGRFKTWGLINDPDCCVPGSRNCPARSYEETYGFDYCPGDGELLKFVGKTGYRDPACDLEDTPLSPGYPLGHAQRQDPCDLKFGTSTGAMGLRKFPNPRFDADKWRELNGSLGTWEKYGQRLKEGDEYADSRASRLLDGSIEPPYLIGMACGACHIAFDPLNPPRDPTHPKWENIVGTIGNQYTRMSEIMASGMPTNSLEWQMFSHARPGTVDTSAVPNDQVNNPGTMNALINLAQRPTFDHDVLKWRRASSCPAGADSRKCWCELDKPGKCWARSLVKEKVHNVLKGGEDSIGLPVALQRVYINIGSCSESCWVNHITDLRQADPQHRNFGQTPVDIGQCRRDCPNFRAIEDRIADVGAFLFTARPTDLYKARGLKSRHDLLAQLEREFGAGSVENGRKLFAQNCARCHSSQTGPLESRDFYLTVSGKPDLRLDWLGNDQVTPASEIGTYRSRALHSNHMSGRIWEEFGSENLRAKKPDPNQAHRLEPNDGGRGYYRNISLLSVWAHAPFMHNNAVGPELCGIRPGSSRDPYNAPELYSFPYVDENDNPLPKSRRLDCWPYDPSVEGRYKLYKASMHALLHPSERTLKSTLLDEDVIIDIGPRLKMGDAETGFRLRIPKGTPLVKIANLDHKRLIGDLVLVMTDQAQLRSKYRTKFESEEKIAEFVNELQELLGAIRKQPGNTITILRKHSPFVQRNYSYSRAPVENAGHPFGEDLSERDKRALTAFLATL